MEITVAAYDLRPAGYGEAPTFRVNGVDVPSERVETVSPEGGTLTYRLLVESKVFTDRGANRLEIISYPWVPAEILGTEDQRQLGHLIDKIEMRAVPSAE